MNPGKAHGHFIDFNLNGCPHKVALAMGLDVTALRALLDGAALDGEPVTPCASLFAQGVGSVHFKVNCEAQYDIPSFLCCRIVGI